MRSFESFFDLDAMAEHLDALDVITMEEFLEAEGKNLSEIDNKTGKEGDVVELPEGLTDWSTVRGPRRKELEVFLQRVGYVRTMKPTDAFLVIPEDPNVSREEDMQYLKDLKEFEGNVKKNWEQSKKDLLDNPGENATQLFHEVKA